MENQICLNGQTIDLSANQLAQIKRILAESERRLSTLAAGETCKIGTHEFVVLEQLGDTAAMIRKDPLAEESEFGNNNNFPGSTVDKICAKFAVELAGLVGEENLVAHTVDLTSDDGLKDYGEIERKVSLLTADMYRQYVEVLDEHNPGEYWWLATPHSTEKHGNSNWVKCVSPSGYIRCNGYRGGGGVRPFCILKSHIFVSN